MKCRTYDLGKRCTQDADPGTSYCWGHKAVLAAAKAEAEADVEAARADAYAYAAYTPVDLSKFDESTRLEDESKRVDDEDKKTPPARCRALNSRGKPCGFWPRKGEDFCVNHGPESQDERAENVRKGVEVRLQRLRERPSVALIDISTGFENRTAIQGTLDVTTKLLLSGRINEKTASIMVRACSVASRNFDAPVRSFSGIHPVSHDWDAYHARTTALLQSIDPILAEALHSQAESDSVPGPVIAESDAGLTAGSLPLSQPPVVWEPRERMWGPGGEGKLPGAATQAHSDSASDSSPLTPHPSPHRPRPIREDPDFSAHIRKGGGRVDREAFRKDVMSAVVEDRVDPIVTLKWMLDFIDLDEKDENRKPRVNQEEVAKIAAAGAMIAHGRPWMSAGMWEIAPNWWEECTLWEQGLKSGKRFRPAIPAYISLEELRRDYERWGRPDISTWPEAWRTQWLEDYPGYPDTDTMWQELSDEWHAAHPDHPPTEEPRPHGPNVVVGA